MTISHGHTLGYGAEFSFLGTMDYSPWLAVPASLNFHTKMGGRELMHRNHVLCVTAARELAQAWGTSLLTDEADLDTIIGAMCVVVLPSALFPFALPSMDGLQRAMKTLHDVLRQRFKLDCQCVVIDEMTAGIRISAQMYNEAADYKALERAVLELI